MQAFESAGAQIDAALDPRLHGWLKDLPLRIALADLTEIQDLAARRAAQAHASTPILVFTASAMQVPVGASVTLSRANGQADVCVAAGDWSGTVEPQGFHQTSALQADSQLLLTCAGSTVRLRAGQDSAVTGESTELTWSSADADSCSASGAWSGSRSLSGTETVGPLTASATFSLNCNGPGGSAMTMISVVVNGAGALRWQAPTEQFDGSPVPRSQASVSTQAQRAAVAAAYRKLARTLAVSTHSRCRVAFIPWR